ALLGQFTGLLGNDQNLIPLQYEEWPNVTEGEKNDLKATVFRCIVIEPPEFTDAATKYIMEDIGRKWKDCKTRLWRNYVVNTYKDKLKKEAEEAGQDFDWDDFVEIPRAWAIEHKPGRISPPMWAQFVDIRLRPDNV
ncbi:hypothetical protein LINPERHAP1_LOCUS9350, partial [Linum perenne]